MKRFLAVLFAWCMIGAANAQVTYTATVGNYTSIADFTSCPSGETCTNYTTAMKQSGSFTVPAALAPNMTNVNIAASIASYSFNDGINTYSKANADDRMNFFNVTTDASGNITGVGIMVSKWLSGTNGSHVVGDQFSYMFLGAVSLNNLNCTGVGLTFAGSADACINENGGVGASFGQSPVAVVWSSAVTSSTPASIPTLSEWGLIITSALLALGTLVFMRRRQA